MKALKPLLVKRTDPPGSTMRPLLASSVKPLPPDPKDWGKRFAEALNRGALADK